VSRVRVSGIILLSFEYSFRQDIVRISRAPKKAKRNVKRMIRIFTEVYKIPIQLA
jgi:hypothetical protein